MTSTLTQDPPQHADTFPLLIKAMRLFNESNCFIRRYSRGEHTYARYLTDPNLRKTLNDINTFRMSWPAHLRRPIRSLGNGIEIVDPELFLIINFTHAAVVNMGEPLITHQTWADEAAKMVLSGIRAILSYLYELNATSYDSKSVHRGG